MNHEECTWSCSLHLRQVNCPSSCVKGLSKIIKNTWVWVSVLWAEINTQVLQKMLQSANRFNSFCHLTKKFITLLGTSSTLAMHATYSMHLYIYDLVILTTLHTERKLSLHILHSICKSSFFHFYTIFGTIWSLSCRQTKQAGLQVLL
jgi:hypothetical protein